MNVIESIASAADEHEAWDVIRDHEEFFIWTDDESPDVRWNEIAAKYGVVERISLEWSAKPTLRRGGVEISVNVVNSRDDSFIVIHALAMLGKDALEVRYCKASHHSSDQAYAVAPAVLWKSIETGVLAEGGRQQFVPLPDSVIEFAKVLYGPNSIPDWAATYTPKPLKYTDQHLH